MTILARLSSQTGDRSQASNLIVARQCLENPRLLDEISGGLSELDEALVGDCAEVLTKVAEQHPEWVAPHAAALSALLTRQSTRLRWEAMHALALVATRAADTVMALVPLLVGLIRYDKSVIVRDYAVDALANYASTSPQAARCAYPYLKESLALWDGKQAAHALQGLVHVSRLLPEHRPELAAIASQHATSARPVVRQAARRLQEYLQQ